MCLTDAGGAPHGRTHPVRGPTQLLFDGGRPESFAVQCTREIANQLLSVAQGSCPDVVPEGRAAMEQAPT